MKTSRSMNNRQSKQGVSDKPIPEIRDNRDNADTTANKKPDQNKHKSVMEHLNRKRHKNTASGIL